MSQDYMIRCDMEGVGGVVHYDQVTPTSADYPIGRFLFMAELRALVVGLRTGGAGRIVVYDMHYFGRNVDLDTLPDGVEVVCGKPPYRSDWAGGLDESFAGMILLGLHSKAGTPDGLLAHSYEHDVADLRLNGGSVGEIGVEAAVAGDCGVPMSLVIGDSAGAREAQVLVPGVEVVVTKQSLGSAAAICYGTKVVTAKIRLAGEALVSRPSDVRPYRVKSPVQLDVELHDGPYLDAFARRFADCMLDTHTIRLIGPSATAVWSEYLEKKLACRPGA